MTSKHDYILRTPRQRLRKLTMDDAEWLLGMLNEPSFISNIGDRGVRSLADAEQYIEENMLGHYRTHGFGMWLSLAQGSLAQGADVPDKPLGMCGLVKRDALSFPDVGFAYLPEFWGLGLATEAARAVVTYTREKQLSSTLLGITSLDNDDSVHVLEKIGMIFQRCIAFDSDTEDTRLFRLDLD